MKKIIAIILLLAAVLSLNACGRTTADAPGDAAKSDNGLADYVVSVADEEGKPVEGVMLQFCNPNTCQVFVTDENGKFEHTAEPYAYEIHVLKTPEGYAADSQLYVMPEEGGELNIILSK